MYYKMCKKVNHSAIVDKDTINGKDVSYCNGVINLMYDDFNDECKKCNKFIDNVEEQESKE